LYLHNKLSGFQHSDIRLVQTKMPAMNPSYNERPLAASIGRGVFISPSWGMSHRLPLRGFVIVTNSRSWGASANCQQTIYSLTCSFGIGRMAFNTSTFLFLKGFLAQVMVDPVDLCFVKTAVSRAFRATAKARSWPKGFSRTIRTRCSRLFILGIYHSESPAPPETNLDSHAHLDGHVARIVHRLAWRFGVSN
jgi:hypothetical protein